MNNKDDIKTFLTVAAVEFSATGQTTKMELPVEVPNILVPVVENLNSQDPSLVARVLGSALLNIMRKKLLNGQKPKDALNNARKGGETSATKEE